jgi:hypothetical protein
VKDSIPPINSQIGKTMEHADWIEDVENTGEKTRWLKQGYDKGWISEAFCSTHDGVPWDEEEEAEWEDGGDPCALCFRFYE